jgi:hypothetical protein
VVVAVVMVLLHLLVVLLHLLDKVMLEAVTVDSLEHLILAVAVVVPVPQGVTQLRIILLVTVVMVCHRLIQEHQ